MRDVYKPIGFSDSVVWSLALIGIVVRRVFWFALVFAGVLICFYDGLVGSQTRRSFGSLRDQPSSRFGAFTAYISFSPSRYGRHHSSFGCARSDCWFRRRVVVRSPPQGRPLKGSLRLPNRGTSMCDSRRRGKSHLSNRITRRGLSATGANQRKQGEDNPLSIGP